MAVAVGSIHNKDEEGRREGEDADEDLGLCKGRKTPTAAAGATTPECGWQQLASFAEHSFSRCCDAVLFGSLDIVELCRLICVPESHLKL